MKKLGQLKCVMAIEHLFAATVSMFSTWFTSNEIVLHFAHVEAEQQSYFVRAPRDHRFTTSTK
jgi:hypothetical protein